MKKHYLKNYIVAFGIASSFCFFPSTIAKAGPSRNPTALMLLFQVLTKPNKSFVRKMDNGSTAVRFLYSDNKNTKTSRITIPQSSVIFTQSGNGENVKLVEGGETKQTVFLQPNQSVYVKTIDKSGIRKIITIEPKPTSLKIISQKISNGNEDVTKITKLTYPSDKNPNGSFEQDITKNSRTTPSQTRYYTYADGGDPSNYKIYTKLENSNGFTSRYEDKNRVFKTQKNSNGTAIQNVRYSNGDTETTYKNPEGVTAVLSNSGDKFTKRVFNGNGDLTSEFVSTPLGYEETKYNPNGTIQTSYKVTNH